MRNLLLSPSVRLARTAFVEREDKAVGLVDQWALGLLASARRTQLSGGPCSLQPQGSVRARYGVRRAAATPRLDPIIMGQ